MEEFYSYLVSVITRYTLLISSAVIFVVSVCKSFKKKTFVLVAVISLLVPYLFFFHGTYRDNGLKIKKNNINEIVSLLDQLDYTPQDDRDLCLINNDYYGSHEFDGIYENIIDGIYIAVEKFSGTPIGKGDFRRNSSVTIGESYVQNGFYERYSRRITLKESDNTTWITSALVADTLGDPLWDCGYYYTGEYYGYFDIQTETNIYSIEYSIETDYQWLNKFCCVRPKKLTAEELLKMFANKQNKYKINF